MRVKLENGLLLWQLRAELAQRDATIALLQAQLQQLEEQLDRVQGQLTAAQARLAELQAQLLRHFKIPPLSPPAGSEQPPKRKALPRRNHDAQPGHPGHHRALLPLDKG